MAVRDSNKTAYRVALETFINTDLTLDRIAQRAGVSEITIAAWRDDYDWATLKKGRKQSKRQLAEKLYGQLNKLNDEIEAGVGYADSKQADIISKLTASITKLHDECGLVEYLEVLEELQKFVEIQYPEHIKTLCDISDVFIRRQATKFDSK